MILENENFWILLTTVAVAVVTTIGLYARKKLIENGFSELQANAIIDPIEDEVTDEVVEGIGEIRKMTKKQTLVALIFIIPILSSCELLPFFASEASKVRITYDNHNGSATQIDSIKIEPHPVYLELDINSMIDGTDYELNKPNGSIWLLKTGSKLRVEVTPKDTTIRIFKK